MSFILSPAFTPHPPKAPAAETKPAAPLADAPAAAEPAAQKEAATETASAETSKTAPAEAAAPETPRAEAKNSGNGSMDFTEEQDRQLLGLKGAGQSWKYIAMTLDKSVGDVKHRYHHIKPKDEAGNSKEPMNDNAAKATEANAKGLAAKAAKEEEKKAKAKAGQEAAQAQAQAQGAAAQNQMPGAYPVNQYVMMEDEFFSFSDLQLIARLVQKEQEHLWLRVASRFYDHTERRIHPDDIRDKVQGRLSYDI
ncbi:hypothetical protein H2201_000303 [Coniosporium apollinis]|uniref:Myb-like domain-containing protein n=1 Tax=Coniosporium apollinis TaxID=61459 RepID=A0ABQ9P4B7_9PEZI|nr:hypothetical protein H2201_000303 [Coniosporium apollinis]